MAFKEFILPWMFSSYKPGITVSSELPITTIRVTPGAWGSMPQS
jgi:hypothetical protein